MTTYKKCWKSRCQRLASHQVTYWGRKEDYVDACQSNAYCLDHAAEELLSAGNASVEPLTKEEPAE